MRLEKDFFNHPDYEITGWVQSGTIDGVKHGLWHRNTRDFENDFVNCTIAMNRESTLYTAQVGMDFLGDNFKSPRHAAAAIKKHLTEKKQSKQFFIPNVNDTDKETS